MNNPILNSESFERAAYSLQHAMERFGGSSQLTSDVDRFQQAVEAFASWVSVTRDALWSNPNRIGSACWYQPAGPSIPPQKWRGGILRMWGTDFDQPNGGGEEVALFPVAVIEDDETQKCVSIYVTRVCFAANPPNQ
jgi:hypothetical protein